MNFFRLLLGALREIFEEAAYERFCIRQGLPPGRNSYAMFLRELNTRNLSRARCC